jgi:hypothetical protein
MGVGVGVWCATVRSEVELLPTNAMRACTASIIEMEFNLQQDVGCTHRAEVEFVSRAEWEREVKEAFALVLAANGAGEDARGKHIKAPEENTPAHEAWCKLRAAYGHFEWTCADALLAAPAQSANGDVDEVAARRKLQASLGMTLRFQASSGPQLQKLYSECVDSVNDGAKGSLWWHSQKSVL